MQERGAGKWQAPVIQIWSMVLFSSLFRLHPLLSFPPASKIEKARAEMSLQSRAVAQVWLCPPHTLHPSTWVYWPWNVPAAWAVVM